MAKGEKVYTIRCDVCGFTKESGSEDTAKYDAIDHAAKVHPETAQEHMIGRHIHIEQ
jgi:hypothetical protein